jgi:hypothetical protein
LVAAGETGLLAFWLAGPCRVYTDRVARNGSANPPGREGSVDGGVDRELGAAQRPVNSHRPGAAEPARSGLDSRVEILGPDVAGDRAMVEEIAGLKVERSVEFNRLPRERPREVGRYVRVDVVVVAVLSRWLMPVFPRSCQLPCRCGWARSGPGERAARRLTH